MNDLKLSHSEDRPLENFDFFFFMYYLLLCQDGFAAGFKDKTYMGIKHRKDTKQHVKLTIS